MLSYYWGLQKLATPFEFMTCSNDILVPLLHSLASLLNSFKITHEGMVVETYCYSPYGVYILVTRTKTATINNLKQVELWRTSYSTCLELFDITKEVSFNKKKYALHKMDKPLKHTNRFKKKTKKTSDLFEKNQILCIEWRNLQNFSFALVRWVIYTAPDWIRRNCGLKFVWKGFSSSILLLIGKRKPRPERVSGDGHIQ